MQQYLQDQDAIDDSTHCTTGGTDFQPRSHDTYCSCDSPACAAAVAADPSTGGHFMAPGSFTREQARLGPRLSALLTNAANALAIDHIFGAAAAR